MFKRFHVQDQEKEFPNLSKMAMDYLAIPATSVSIEREFSLTADICSPKRSSLTANSIRQTQELKSFLKFGGDAIFEYIMRKMEMEVDTNVQTDE